MSRPVKIFFTLIKICIIIAGINSLLGCQYYVYNHRLNRLNLTTEGYKDRHLIESLENFYGIKNPRDYQYYDCFDDEVCLSFYKAWYFGAYREIPSQTGFDQHQFIIQPKIRCYADNTTRKIDFFPLREADSVDFNDPICDGIYLYAADNFTVKFISGGIAFDGTASFRLIPIIFFEGRVGYGKLKDQSILKDFLQKYGYSMYSDDREIIKKAFRKGYIIQWLIDDVPYIGF